MKFLTNWWMSLINYKHQNSYVNRYYITNEVSGADMIRYLNAIGWKGDKRYEGSKTNESVKK